jgi:outer membrane protein OmpA-like peptidoglycan-associated protein
MNTNTLLTFNRTLIVSAVVAALLSACAAAPMKPAGAVEVRTRLTQLQTNPQLADRAPVAMKEADTAVRAAEEPRVSEILGLHLVFIADRKVETARALAESSLAEDQRTALSGEREKARLDARTHEADVAKVETAVARADSAEQKLAADRSRVDAEAARASAANAQLQTADLQRQASEMQRQIEEMNAKVTDRGVVLTLGDVLFTTGRADLKAAATGNLNKLVTFLGKYPDRTVLVEGYTDNVGSDGYNQGLSQRRADGVKSYLVGQGVGNDRLTSLGKGESGPVGDNDSSDGRQLNRRVEVVISNPPVTSLR